MSLYIDNYDIVYLTKKFKNGKQQKGYDVESHVNGKNVHDKRVSVHCPDNASL